jgi:hypothetical protein
MRTAFLLIAMLALPAYAAQVVWKWVDEAHVTHYSDTPVPGATKVELGGGNRSAAAPPTRPQPAPANPQPSADAGPAYRNFEIWKPVDNESFSNTGGQVSIAIRVEPALQPEHALSLYLDGRLVEGFAPNTAEFELKDVPRGLHSVTATITNARSAVIQRTSSIRFNVQQVSIAQPPVGPGVRPPAKPQRQGSTKPLISQPSYAALNGARASIDPRTNRPTVTLPRPTPPKQP